jgi:glycine cleavage system aminomethyltransferase T
VTDQGKVVGAVTSVAWSPVRNAPVALALLARSVDVPAIVQVQTEGEALAAAATALAAPTVEAPAAPARAGVVRFR